MAKKADVKVVDSSSNNNSSSSTSSSILSAEDFLRGGDSPYQRLEIPELSKDGKPGVVYLKALPALDVIQYSASEDDKDQQGMFRLIGHSLVTPEGELIFREDQIQKLGKILSISVYSRISRAILAMANLKDTSDSQEGKDSGETVS